MIRHDDYRLAPHPDPIHVLEPFLRHLGQLGRYGLLPCTRHPNDQYKRAMRGVHDLLEQVARELKRAREMVGMQPRPDIGRLCRRGSERIGRNRRARVLVFKREESRSGVFAEELASGGGVDVRRTQQKLRCFRNVVLCRCRQYAQRCEEGRPTTMRGLDASWSKT